MTAAQLPHLVTLRALVGSLHEIDHEIERLLRAPQEPEILGSPTRTHDQARSAGALRGGRECSGDCADCRAAHVGEELSSK